MIGRERDRSFLNPFRSIWTRHQIYPGLSVRLETVKKCISGRKKKLKLHKRCWTKGGKAISRINTYVILDKIRNTVDFTCSDHNGQMKEGTFSLSLSLSTVFQPQKRAATLKMCKWGREKLAQLQSNKRETRMREGTFPREREHFEASPFHAHWTNFPTNYSGRLSTDESSNCSILWSITESL